MKHRLKLLGIVALAICCLAVPISDAKAQCTSGFCQAPGYFQPAPNVHASPVISPVVSMSAAPAVSVVPVRSHRPAIPSRYVAMPPAGICVNGVCRPPVYRPPAYRASRSFGISFHSQRAIRPAYPIRW